jgi:hypothetical protein
MPIVELPRPGSPLTQGDIGHFDLSAAELVVNQLRATKASRAAQGKEFAEAELTTAVAKWEALRNKMAPFSAELTRRTGTPPPEESGRGNQEA